MAALQRLLQLLDETVGIAMHSIDLHRQAFRLYVSDVFTWFAKKQLERNIKNLSVSEDNVWIKCWYDLLSKHNETFETCVFNHIYMYPMISKQSNFVNVCF